jgi:DNA-binding winged helix-turn-helix (wHTH) protein/TolB-like protein/tetratricopeptide (TPR) repeat protein
VELKATGQVSYGFGDFVLDTGRRLLFSADRRQIPLKPKVFDTLFYLLTNNGRIVEKDELMSAVWPDTIVEENNLNKNISALRKALGEALGEHRYIVTVPGRGYQFVADVTVFEKEDAKIDDVPARTLRSDRRVLLMVGGMLIATLMVGGLMFARRERAGPSSVKTLAVLPFHPIVAANRDEALELGMADTLISRMGGVGMIVRPLSSVRRFGGIGQDAVEAGRALGVESVLEGNLQRWGDKIRVSVRLVNVADGSLLWSGTFDEKYTDIFGVQDSISNRVTAALSVRLSNSEREKLEKRYTNDANAYSLYMRGRYHTFKVTETDLRKAIDLFQTAIDADPNYALAYAGMADAYRVLVSAAYARAGEACPKAKDLAARALALDDTLVDAHVVLGWVGLLYDWNLRDAERELRRAIELDPNNAEAHRAYAHLLSNWGRHEEAVNEGRLARELAPLTVITSSVEAQILFFAGRGEDALDRARKTLDLDPDFWVAHNVIGRVLADQGYYTAAIAELHRAYELSGGSPEPLMHLGYAYAASGDRASAESQVEKLRQLARDRYVPAYNIAMIYNGLGESEMALGELEKSLAEREAALAFVRVDGRWNAMRSNPRFASIVARMDIVE